ncbi:MAG: adenosylcobinamide-GDP ribazoletransferase [Rhodospirillaceae bacterium]|nr:adenosylcobinamide-GDP ribazoletransferase [Rhodospirillaceae bacterium]|tara:strand:- start:3003 stop:3761 length:759 start_codon:yes stop_codon:yes gene_type:complete
MDDEHDSDWLGRLRLAAMFLTRLPVSGPDGMALARATPLFPVVGAGVGLVAGLAFCFAAWLGVGPWLGAVAAVLAGVVATGALHEDGLADVADGFGVHGERQRRLDVMRDSRIGAFGVIALVLALAAKIGALAALGQPELVVVALVSSAALSRAFVVVAMRMMPSARDDGLGAGAGAPRFEEALIALAVGGAIALALTLSWSWLVVVLAGATAALIMAWRTMRAFGGQTGDVLGAIVLVSDIAMLAAFVAFT